MYYIIGLLFIVCRLLCIRQPDGRDSMFGRTLKPFYQMSEGIYRVFFVRLAGKNYIAELTGRLQLLYPNRGKEKLVRQYICYKCSMVLTVVFLATVLCGVISFSQKASSGVTSLQRADYWGNEREETLKVRVEGIGEEEISVTVPEKRYSKKQLSGILEEMGESLETVILGENESLDSVTENLNLVAEVPDTQVEVFWEMDTDAYMDYRGILVPDAVTEAGAIVNLTAVLSYDNEVCRHSFAVHLQKPELSREERLKKDLKKQLETMNAISGDADFMELPAEIDGRKISYEYPQDTSGYKIFLLFLIGGVLLFFIQDEKLQKELNLRKKQMQLDYPEIVSKLTLLLGAGMTIRRALEKISLDYERKRKTEKQQQRFAYDEILYVCREMQGGISERAAIDMLSRRCRIPCYMKLCSLLLQNLKKGSRGMAESLSYEVGQAFEERKLTAKRLGEEAGTKLLLPMGIMLAIVMAVLIIPAFLSI